MLLHLLSLSVKKPLHNPAQPYNYVLQTTLRIENIRFFLQIDKVGPYYMKKNPVKNVTTQVEI